MNSKEISPNANARLKRIKIVSRIFRVLLGLYIVIGTLSFVVWAGYLANPPVGTRLWISLSTDQTYYAPFNIPARVIVIFGSIQAIRVCLIGFGIILLNRLFVSFEQGSFFTNKNVRCIKFLGLIMAGDWFAGTILELMGKTINIEFAELFFGLFIILIAWIMDEARKIQEEQELTV